MQSKQLFMSLINNKQFLRQIQLLKHLSSVRTPTSISDLLRIVGCTTPTLRTDIRELNESLHSQIQVKSSRKDGFYLDYPEGLSISSVIMDLAKKSDVYRIIDEIFHNNAQSFEHLATKLYISPYSLRKLLTHMNAVLEEFDIYFSFSSVDFIGRETDIRFFLFTFYHDFNDYFAVDNDFDRNALAYKELIDGTKEFMKPDIHLGQFRATLWIMIISNRIKNNHFVKLSDSFRSRIKKMHHYPNFSTSFKDAFYNVLSIRKPPEDDIIWAFSVILHCISYSQPTADIDSPCKREYNLSHTVSKDHLERINDFLSLEFNQDTLGHADLDRIRSFLINLDILTDLSPKFQRCSFEVKMLVKQSINEYFQIWMRHLYSEKARSLFKIHYIEDIAVGLALMHFSLLSQMKRHELRILFVFQGESGYDDFLIQQTKFMIPQNIASCYIFDEPITEEILDTAKPDLIVSNFEVPDHESLPCDVIKMSYIPTLIEWTSLQNIIMNLSSLT